MTAQASPAHWRDAGSRPAIGKLQRLDGWIASAEMVLSVLCLAAISLITIVAVFYRYVLQDPIDWGMELSMVLLVWLTFLGTAAVYRSNGHIAVSSLPARLPRPWRLAVAATVAAITMLCMVVIGWYGVQMAMVQHGQVLSMLGIPRSIFSVPILWAAVSIGFCTLVRLAGTAALPAAGGG